MQDEFLSNEFITEEEAEEIVEIVKEGFPLGDWRLYRKRVEFTCELSGDVETKFRNVMGRLKKKGYLPSLSRENDKGLMKVAKYDEPKGGVTSTHYILFSATILTTLTAGALMFGVNILENPLSIWRGWPFSAAILLILGSHELGHFFLSAKRDVVATLPYFIPVPPPFILGTLGAVIRMKSPIPDRKSLFDIGAAGPFLGLILAIPVTLVGLYLSPVDSFIQLGRPLIFRALTCLIPMGKGGIHPVAFAGWVGFFVTFLNLLPVGQLDGGHVAKSLVGDYHKHISKFVPVILLFMGFFLGFIAESGGQIWIFWGFISLFFHSAGHPPPLNQVSGLDTRRKMIGLILFVIMLACFIPVPFSV